jgi:Arc/MetJ family transcription regulator
MPTNLNLDDRLLEDAWRLSGKRTKREAVNEALHEYVQRRKQKRLLRLFGKLEWDAAYDHKKDRSRK